MKTIYYTAICFLCFYSLNAQVKKSGIEKWKQEILNAESGFADMVKEKGMQAAFVAFAADDAVIMRKNELVKGRTAIETFYQNQNAKGLSWTAEFVDVSESGDIGYTYGHYTFSHTDKDGKAVENTGVFHTVWKRQPDHSWKFVWD